MVFLFERLLSRCDRVMLWCNAAGQYSHLAMGSQTGLGPTLSVPTIDYR